MTARGPQAYRVAGMVMPVISASSSTTFFFSSPYDQTNTDEREHLASHTDLGFLLVLDLVAGQELGNDLALGKLVHTQDFLRIRRASVRSALACCRVRQSGRLNATLR